MESNKKTIRYAILGAMGCVLLYWMLHETERVMGIVNVAMQMVKPFLVGACLAFILNVPMRAIERQLNRFPKLKGKRAIAILLTFVALLLVLAGVIGLLVPQIQETVETLAQQLLPFLDRVEEMVFRFLDENPEILQWVQNNTELESYLKNYDWAALAEQAVDMLGDRMTVIVNGTVSAVGSLVSTIWSVFVSLIFGLYCLSNKELLARQGRKLVYSFLPERWADEIIRVFRLSNTTFSNFISGQCLEVVILGCLFAVTMAIFQMPYIPLVSVLVAITAFIPVVGAWIGCIFGAFFILVNDPMQAVWFVVMFLVLQQIENNLIYPRVVGTSIGLPSMWVLVAVTIGGDVMGVAGMLLMIPLASVLYTLMREYTTKRVEQRQIDPEKLKDQPPVLKSKLKEKRENAKKKREAKKAAELAELMKRSLHIPDHKDDEKAE